MLETILAMIGGALALLFGSGWIKSSRHRRQLEADLAARQRAATQQQDAAAQAVLKINDELARRRPIDTENRSDFE